ncbi:hypothetical protein AB0F72_09355 [Actinoplanes sp. NPDC023936]|uniref:hypothetical protein n=1 Tax=Actinoplanes sp. NPDC023936 TaxID=3154910 RepID=UPI0033F56879
MTDPHKQHPDDFDDTKTAAYGAFIGHTAGHGEELPPFTRVQGQAFDVAITEAFDAGWRARAEVTV